MNETAVLNQRHYRGIYLIHDTKPDLFPLDMASIGRYLINLPAEAKLFEMLRSMFANAQNPLGISCSL